MYKFMNEDFLLKTETARTLFHQYGEKQPIVDFHNHLIPREIYEDKTYGNLTEVWLGGDHYKWRAMRANGVPERLITGDGAPYEKFLAWADTVQNCIGNPLYHWTHLELQRYFGITEPLSPKTAKTIWDICNEKLRTPAYSARNLLKMQGVEVLCTTDDPADDLQWHKKLAEEGFDIRVLPTFRPGSALDIEKESFSAYLERLGSPKSLEELLSALEARLDYFVEAGCRVTDHSLEGDFYLHADEKTADGIFQKRLAGETLTDAELAQYKGYVLTTLGRAYARRGLVMQLHIGALRNNSTRMFRKLGADTGLDSLHDFDYAPQLSALLDAMDQSDELPKTILYCLNPKDLPMLAAMAGNYQGNEMGIKGKVQLGSAWWFCDHKNGMELQLRSLADVGVLPTFVGMLTDSRSFLSFPRHEYFRRILCNLIGEWVENGEYPADLTFLDQVVENICCQNAKTYFCL